MVSKKKNLSFGSNPTENQYTLPYNIEVEALLLGGLLQDNSKFYKLSIIVKAHYFYLKIHELLYKHIASILTSTNVSSPKLNVATAQTLKHIVDNDEELKKYGYDYLLELSQKAIVLNIIPYAKIIRELYLKRQLVQLGQNVIENATSTDTDKNSEEVIFSAEKQLYNISSINEVDKKIIGIGDASQVLIRDMQQVIKKEKPSLGIPCGFSDLNKRMGTFFPSDFVVLSGRPGMGKTTLALNMMYNIAKSNYGRVLFFSLEMATPQIVQKLLSINSLQNYDGIRRGVFSEQKFFHMANAAKNIAKFPIFVDDSAPLSLARLIQKAYRAKNTHNIEIIFIDYLQLLTAEQNFRQQNRTQEMSEISRGLKLLAKDLDIPIIALSQLSRNVEHRDNKRPMLSDLRDSGSIEQDADMVLFLYRGAYYENNKNSGKKEDQQNDMSMQEQLQEERKAEIIIAKNRYGSTGKVFMEFDGAKSKFMDISPEQSKF